MSWLAVTLVLPASLLAIADWRKGLIAMIVVAFLQDPLRKLELDRPVYFTVLAGIVFAAAYLRAQGTTRFMPTQIPGWKHFLSTPFGLWLVLLAAQAGNSLVSNGNPIIVAIGALSYLGPLPALLAGYHFALKRGRIGIEVWLTWYLAVALIMLPSIVLEYAGIDWPVLGDVGEGFYLVQEDTVLTANSGFFRASEPAAWHTATAICVLVLLSSVRRITRTRLIAVGAIIVGLLAIGVLTGRRKIFIEIIIFLSVYVSLLALFGKGGVRLAIGVVIAGLLSFAVVSVFVDEKPTDIAGQDAVRYQRYAERGATVGDDLADRVVSLGIEPVQWAVEGFGWLGGGLGVASQGAQHFGGGAEVYGGAGEGGLGKITAELGVPGLALAIWFALAAARYAWNVLRFVSRFSTRIARLAYGLIAFLIANLAVFFVATQIFGDLFVLLLLGFVAGFFLATPVLAGREHAQRKLASVAATDLPPRVVSGVSTNLARRAGWP